MLSFAWLPHFGHFIARISGLLMSLWGYGPAAIALSVVVVTWRFVKEVLAYYQQRYFKLNWRACVDVVRHAFRRVKLSWGTKLTMSVWFVLIASAAGNVVWKDHLDLLEQRNKLESLERSEKKQVETLKSQADVLTSQLQALNQPPEPPDSLRRRTKRLADEIDKFWDETNSTTIPRGNGRADAVGEQGSK